MLTFKLTQVDSKASVLDAEEIQLTELILLIYRNILLSFFHMHIWSKWSAAPLRHDGALSRKGSHAFLPMTVC